MTSMHAADGLSRRSPGSSATAPATIAMKIVHAVIVSRPSPRTSNTTRSTALDRMASTPPTTAVGLTSRWYGWPSRGWWLSSAGLATVRQQGAEALEDPVDARCVEREAPVDHQVLARDEPGEVGAEEHDHVGDVLGLARPAHRCLADDVVD